jgi:hypothetical protein
MVASHRNRSEQRFARMLAASEGIKYTEALRRVRAFQTANEKKEESDVTYHIYNSEGEDIAGDRELTPGLKKMADDVDGYIVDDQTGKQVYPVEETTDETIPPLAGPLPVED